MILPILEIPKEIDEVCHNYKGIFSKPQYAQFTKFITGIIIEDKADIEALSQGYKAAQSYDRLHQFVQGSPWEINNVLEETVKIIKNLPEGQCFHGRGMLIIDDTLIEKCGKYIEEAGKLYDHAQGRYLEHAHCLVGLCWSDNQKLRYPLRFELYKKAEKTGQEEGSKDKEKKETTTKIEIAKQLIKWSVEQGIPFDTVVFDSWFFARELVDYIESLGKDWISMSKSNRLIRIQGKTISMKDYSRQIVAEELPVLKIKGREYAVKSIQTSMESLKRGLGRVRLLVCYEKETAEKGGGYKEPVYLVSNRKDIRPERLIRGYQIRWSIETFFKDAKSNLGLGDYQMRKLKGIKSHWCLVFTSAIVLELMKHKACTEKGQHISEMSFGELKAQAFRNTLRHIINLTINFAEKGQSKEQIYAFMKI